ncbi:MAG: bifunctional pyr operon transcriptional regulator/uracil phosphoribosyltransferase PyrR [Candidatus Hydrogenedentes bacterium]|jgi:pyrimidine operon attenuation protein/uracil phosphoribosyltransferase|nr:bifunctional pyr operon transcriptional regulator/uracil phosphoribosyltransferase PyrR [Candidatus Hydrogenedentota bacterium]
MVIYNESNTAHTVVMDAKAMAETLRTIARAVVDGNPEIQSLVILGILSRGRPLADRLAELIHELTGYRPQVGSLSTTFYRDDLHAGSGAVVVRSGQTHFDFSVDERTVLLVDDVIAAGRTTRAALDEVMDYGRPHRIQLVSLVDRGCRELPIQPDYLGMEITTKPEEWVSVHIEEIDGEDAVLLNRRLTSPKSEEN